MKGGKTGLSQFGSAGSHSKFVGVLYTSHLDSTIAKTAYNCEFVYDS